MAQDQSKDLPITYEYQFNSLFDPILSEFDSEVSLYEQVMATFDPDQFAHLQKKPKISVAGLTVFEGGIIEGMLSLAGKGTSKDIVITRRISVAGHSTFKDLVAVAEKGNIAGSSHFMENAIFGGLLKIAGRSRFNKNVVISGGLKLSGKVNITDYLLADSPVKIEGNLNASSIRSSDKLTLNGKLFISQDVVARDIHLGKSSGTIQGSVYAEKISLLGDERPTKNLNTVGGLFAYLKRTISRALTGRSHKQLRIEGDVFADDVDISNVIILGDVITKKAKIGDNTIIHGTVYYEDSLESEDNAKITSELRSISDTATLRKSERES